MKSIIGLLLLSSMGLILPSKAVTAQVSEEPSTYFTYLVLTENGLYNGEKGEDNYDLFLENVIKYEAAPGSLLPGSDVITNSVEGVTFDSWVSYNGNGVPESYTKVTEGIEILYASWINDGTAGIGGNTQGGGNEGGNTGGDVGGGDTTNYTWYIVGSGSFVNGPDWKPAGGIGMTENAEHPYSDAEFMALSVTFEAGDIWKICKHDESEWIQTGWESQAGSAIANKQMQSVSDNFGGNNISVLVSGTYDIYLKLYNNGSPTVWIAKSN